MSNLNNYSAIVYAYIGDAVLELLIRDKLINYNIPHVGDLNKQAQKLVRASAQSERLEKILPLLLEDEEKVFKLARNHKTNSKPKSAGVIEYRRATGFEAIFGYLHTEKREERIKELFDIAYSDFEEVLGLK